MFNLGPIRPSSALAQAYIFFPFNKIRMNRNCWEQIDIKHVISETANFVMVPRILIFSITMYVGFECTHLISWTVSFNFNFKVFNLWGEPRKIYSIVCLFLSFLFLFLATNISVCQTKSHDLLSLSFCWSQHNVCACVCALIRASN